MSIQWAPDYIRGREFGWMDRGEVVYLNAASTGPLPASAVRAVNGFNAKRAEPHTISFEEQFGVISEARIRCARLVGADPSEIAVAVNTTYGINLAARALPLASGDVVVTSDREFPANIYPWMALEERGVKLHLVPCRDGLPDEEALITALDMPGVRVLAISWVSFATGARVDLERLGTACRARGIYFVVDAIQGVGAAELDLSTTPVDILACGAQKWLLSPWGTGFLYVRRTLIEQLAPDVVGWLAVKGSSDFERLLDYQLVYHDDARRFEQLTGPFQDYAAVNSSLGLFEEIGHAQVVGHIERCVSRIIDWAASRNDVRLITPPAPERRAGIVALEPADSAAASARLTAAEIVHVVREGRVRLAPHFYTTEGDITRTLVALEG